MLAARGLLDGIREGRKSSSGEELAGLSGFGAEGGRGKGTCTTGSPQTNLALRGTVPAADDYTGVKFVLGLPEELNHLDGARAPAPFNVPGMWWAWKGGYKFIRLDLDRVDMPADQESVYFHHLGATTCDGATTS